MQRKNLVILDGIKLYLDDDPSNLIEMTFTLVVDADPIILS